MKDNKKDINSLTNFIKSNVNKLHLQEQLKTVNEDIKFLKENDENSEEAPYQKNTYEGYDKDLLEVTENLSKASQILETAVLKQESHMKMLPQVAERTDAGKKAKNILIDVFKEVKAAKLNTERKIYQ